MEGFDCGVVGAVNRWGNSVAKREIGGLNV